MSVFTPDRRSLFGAFLVLVSLAWQGHAQEAMIRTDGNTQVRSIGFRFQKGRSFSEKELRARVSLTERGSSTGLRNTFDFLPLVESVGVHPFDPLELQKDLARIRRLYHGSGFIDAAIDYDVRFDPEENLVDVEFLIDEGPPLMLRRLRVCGADTMDTFALPSDLAQQWRQDSSTILPRAGATLSTFTVVSASANSVAWLADRGYPFATGRSAMVIDTAAHMVDVNFSLDTGPRARISAITITGVRSVRDEVLLRELPFTVGGLYSTSDLREGSREIQALGLFRRAVVSVPQGMQPSGEVPVTVDVTEGPLRSVIGSAGYDSRGGITFQGEWLHRNLTGDARTFSVSALAQTGLLAIESVPEILYRGSVSLTQPYVFHRRLSLLGGPFVEYRNDYRDRSNAYGLSTTLVYQVDPYRSIAVREYISKRNIQEVRFGEYESGAIDILTLLSNIARGQTTLKNSLALQVTFGDLDDLTVPTRGFMLRPTTEVTWIPGLNSVEYWRGDLAGYLFMPFSNTTGLAVRGIAGTLLPFGKGLPQGDETAEQKFLQLRDAVFTAGGPEDVRGWGSRLLGPKFPNILITENAGDTTYSVNGYIPVGGLARIAFSLEFRLPFPGLSPSAGLSLYLDGGRVWNPQPEFQNILGWEDETAFFYAVGAGFLYRLPVGTMRLDLGYKLNPSYQDIRDASDVTRALAEGTPLDQVPVHESWRLHGHFSISVSF